MADATVESRLRALVVDEIGCDEKEVTLKARFSEDLGTDSLDMIEIIMRIEEEFGIEIPDDCPELESGKTFGDAVKYVESRV